MLVDGSWEMHSVSSSFSMSSSISYTLYLIAYVLGIEVTVYFGMAWIYSMDKFDTQNRNIPLKSCSVCTSLGTNKRYIF